MILPLAQLAARLVKHPFAYGDYRPGALGDGNEYGRLDDTARWMVPANVRLEADETSRRDLHLRLIEQLQLAALDGHQQLARQQHTRVHLLVEIGTVEPITVAPIVFGAIEREIRLNHEVGRPARG